MTEIQCDIVPYTECTMSMEATPYRSYEMVPKVYRKKECTEGMDTVQHTKMMPECRNVTKQNCITNWETDEDGNQVTRPFSRFPANIWVDVGRRLIAVFFFGIEEEERVLGQILAEETASRRNICEL